MWLFWPRNNVKLSQFYLYSTKSQGTFLIDQVYTPVGLIISLYCELISKLSWTWSWGLGKVSYKCLWVLTFVLSCISSESEVINIINIHLFFMSSSSLLDMFFPPKCCLMRDPSHTFHGAENHTLSYINLYFQVNMMWTTMRVPSKTTWWQSSISTTCTISRGPRITTILHYWSLPVQWNCPINGVPSAWAPKTLQRICWGSPGDRWWADGDG